MENKTKVWIPVIVGISIAIGIFIGSFVSNRTNQSGGHNILGKVFNSKSKLQTILDLIDAQYVEDVDVDSITEEMMPLILAKLDPHSVYIPAKDLEKANADLEGKFSGIGVQFNIIQDTIMVISVIPGGPSEAAGILAGDRIVTVNDTSMVGKSITDEKVISKLRGEKNTKVKVGIRRKSSRRIMPIVITRNDVPVKSVDVSYIISPQIGYIKVSNFGAQTVDEFKSALEKLTSKGAKKFIIDLRGNPGGFLESAIAMVNEFLSKDNLIVYTEGKAYPRKDDFADGSGACQKNPIVVLIDEWSASASEIFAGAMQDNDRALIIGRRSFGKGLVQEQLPFSDGSAVRLTIARYYTPSGRCIQKPYKKGDIEDYEMDIINRYQHGEFTTKDSIKVADSLKYQTLKLKRTVYGGGGIMPDIFVSKDTLGYTPYYNRIVNNGILLEYAYKYVDGNRLQLKQLRTWQQILNQLNNQDLLSGLVGYAQTRGVKPNARQINKSKTLLIQLLRAYIARNIKGDDAFYPILNLEDPCVFKAVNQLKMVQGYNDRLKIVR